MTANPFPINRWIHIALLNFFILSLTGVILRYKINFPLPIINQKYLLHSHSHFAFAGWISLALMALMIQHLHKTAPELRYRKYKWILIAHTAVAYGMLSTFVVQGYATLSITFSSLSILVSYFFLYFYWRDLNRVKQQQQQAAAWFKVSLLLLGLSSLGTFALAYLMATGIQLSNLYHACIYFYLHFQYNGWFIFSCFGLLCAFMQEHSLPGFIENNRKLLLIFSTAVVPAYLLSLPEINFTNDFFWLAALSAIVQLAALYYSFRLWQSVRQYTQAIISNLTRYLWTLAMIALCLKIVLQLLSIFPVLNHMAFGLRPVVIAYLHLCFLGIVSFFILGYFNELLLKQGLQLNKSGIWIFIAGVLLQELFLLLQAVQAIWYYPIPHTGRGLFIAAIVMAAGLAKMVFSKKVPKTIV